MRADRLARLPEFAIDYRGLAGEVDINPLVVLPQGEGVYALDALIVPAPVKVSSESF